MDIDQLTKKWHKKASKEDDYFSKFMSEYVAFIAFLGRQKFKDESTDRGVIQALKRDDDTKKYYLQRISKDKPLKEAWESIISKFEKQPFRHSNGSTRWNCSHEPSGPHIFFPAYILTGGEGFEL